MKLLVNLLDFRLGINVEQVNPLLRVPLFREFRVILAEFMGSGDLSKLESDLQKLVEDQTPHGTWH